MRVFVNGAQREVASGTTVAAVLVAEGLAERRVAVEVNREVVPRSAHATRVLCEGDRLELVHALGGG